MTQASADWALACARSVGLTEPIALKCVFTACMYDRVALAGMSHRTRQREPPLYLHSRCDDHFEANTSPYREGLTFAGFRAAVAAMEIFPECEAARSVVTMRKELAPENAKLHHLLTIQKKILMPYLLEQMCAWYEYPPQLAHVKLKQARWLEQDGNHWSFVGDDGTQFWYVSWGGS